MGRFLLLNVYFCTNKFIQMSLKKAYILIFLVLLIDQVSKIYIKTHFVIREEVHCFNWF